MSQKTQLFCVATEGATIDGRQINRQWIDDMAETYDPKKYTARIWLEHIRGTLPDSPFKALGDVLAVEARDVEGGKRGLYAQLAATPDLVAINKASQKVFTSIEVTENFADSGKAYLAGLGVTDSPASLGTDRLHFSSRHGKRELPAGHHFSTPLEVTIEFEDDEPSLFATVSEKVTALLNTFKAKNDKQFNEVSQVLESVAECMGDVSQQMGELASLRETVSRLETELATQAESFTALKASLDNTPEGEPRPRASGGSTDFTTDC